MRRLLYFVLACVAVLVGGHFLRGAFGYTTGTATLEYVGYPGYGNGNLDPRSRVPWGTTGCTFLGHEALTQGANNLGVQMMGTLFGTMPGAYDGPYPTKQEARNVLAAEGRLFDPWMMDDPTHPLSVDWSQIPQNTRLFMDTAQRVLGGIDPDAPPSRLAVLEQRALLVGTYDSFGDACRIVVLDMVEGDVESRPVARYSYPCRPVR